MTTTFGSDDMRPQISHYRTLLSSFLSSPSAFKILHSLPSPASSSIPPKHLLTLDSSFNPPTLAHFRLCTTALSTLSTSTSLRILLLLATTNADKAPQPASFEERLVMMQIFARELSSSRQGVGVDIAVTKYPYFVDKSKAISQCDEYGNSDIEQVHLIGYDTLLRLLDTKYYPPDHRLDSVVDFLEKHRLLVTYRTDDKWEGREEQDAFVRRIGDGSLDKVGGKRTWVSEGRLQMVEGRKKGEEIISSTKVREACRKRDEEALKGLVTKGVTEWVLSEKLYLEDD